MWIFSPIQDGLWVKSKCFSAIFIVYIVTLHFKKLPRVYHVPVKRKYELMGTFRWRRSLLRGERGGTDAAGWLCSSQTQHSTQVPDLSSFCCPEFANGPRQPTVIDETYSTSTTTAPIPNHPRQKRAPQTLIDPHGEGDCAGPGNRLVPLGLKVLGSWEPCGGNWEEDYAEKEHALSVPPMPNPMGSKRLKEGWSKDLSGIRSRVKMTIAQVQWCYPEIAMTPHSSTLAWKIPRVEEPGRLQSMVSLGVGHDWVTSHSCIG